MDPSIQHPNPNGNMGNPRANTMPNRGSPPTPSPAPMATMAPPPDSIYGSDTDLMSSVGQFAKDQGYGIVKLRTSNYREGKPTRFDLVCDRGGVRYNSTAKKRNPSTRKIDCPFKAKAVCEVQLGHQWRFAVQNPDHNHEPRLPAGAPGQENAPLATSLRTLANKMDRISHDMTNSFNELQKQMANLDKRLENLEAREAGYQQMEAQRMDGMGMDDVESRLLASSVL
ncbi:hypothetical protein B0I35DRAFT_442887 [Stachybotrys elegans]|uniref:FAR1 domain-containing protein n=1 Tax=Stachybotrys elegans TaxID=80388 RepID=A0A8K0WM21_9HYPO|nr:hypothetical protein B0I35DRAFT_442887 [Stachybotrys elegans]